jgi:hypothetical protein
MREGGPRAREVCGAVLRLLRLPRLTPRGVDDAAELLAALKRPDGRHHGLQGLDLRHVAELVTAETLVELCEALPNLSTLRLPDRGQGCKLTAAEVAAATAGLSRLTALHVPCVSGLAAAALLPKARAHHLQVLTLATPLLAAAVPALAPFSALSALSFKGKGFVRMDHVLSLAAQLPALAALELEGSFMTTAYPLQRLTRLTSLSLTGHVGGELTMNEMLLGHVGTLTGLASLALDLLWDEDADRKQILWLDDTTALTTQHGSLFWPNFLKYHPLTEDTKY